MPQLRSFSLPAIPTGESPGRSYSNSAGSFRELGRFRPGLENAPSEKYPYKRPDWQTGPDLKIGVIHPRAVPQGIVLRRRVHHFGEG